MYREMTIIEGIQAWLGDDPVRDYLTRTLVGLPVSIRLGDKTLSRGYTRGVRTEYRRTGWIRWARRYQVDVYLTVGLATPTVISVAPTKIIGTYLTIGPDIEIAQALREAGCRRLWGDTP